MAKSLVSLTDAEYPVVFFANGIGDALLSLPTLRALTEIFPERLTLITHGGSRYLKLLKPLATKRQLYIRTGTKRDWEHDDIEDLVAAVGECDLFISLVAWHSESLEYLVKRLAPAKSVGYFSFFDYALPRDYSKHTAELTFDAVKTLSAELNIMDYIEPPSYPAQSVQFVQDIRASLGSDVRLLTVHMETLDEKMWDPLKLTAFLERFLASHPEYVAMFVNHLDYPMTSQSNDFRKRVIVEGGLSLEDTMCLVQNSDSFLGIDSCMLHAADFGRVPAVGLFGPTNAAEFGFLVGPHVVIQTRSEVKEIEVDSVLAAMEHLLKDPNQRVIWTQ